MKTKRLEKFKNEYQARIREVVKLITPFDGTKIVIITHEDVILDYYPIANKIYNRNTRLWTTEGLSSLVDMVLSTKTVK